MSHCVVGRESSLSRPFEGKPSWRGMSAGKWLCKGTRSLSRSADSVQAAMIAAPAVNAAANWTTAVVIAKTTSKITAF